MMKLDTDTSVNAGIILCTFYTGSLILRAHMLLVMYWIFILEKNALSKDCR
jgi:hypothetical protein